MRRLKSEDELFVKSAEEIRIARQKGVVFGRAKIIFMLWRLSGSVDR